MMDRAEYGLQQARRKWEASEAGTLGFPRPASYAGIEGRIADGLYLGPDADGVWALVEKGSVVRAFESQAEAGAFYANDVSNPSAPRMRFASQEPPAEIEPLSAAPMDSQESFGEWFAKNEARAMRRSPDELRQLAQPGAAQPAKVQMLTSSYVRNPIVAALAKLRADGVCELCHEPAPFSDPFGSPYLESHHVDWLSRGGPDRIDNVVALCPNCHRKMHVLDDPGSLASLKSAAAR